MKDFTYSVIGCGFMGSVLARVARQLPYTRCVAVCDVHSERASQLAGEVGGKAFDDYEDMLDACPAEAVIIATPEPEHLQPVLSASRHGSHILLEKPIATTLSDADRIIQACADARVRLLVGQILRFEVNYALIKSAVAEGSIGRFLSAYARRITPITEAWRLAGRVSPVSYIGVHDIDQFLWYHPLPVRSVYAQALYGRVWEQLRTYDMAWMMIEFEDGALGVHEVGWCLPEEWAKWESPSGWGGFGDVRMNVIGTHGNLNLDFTPMDLFGVNREGWKHPDTRHWPQMHGQLVGAARLEVEHFFDCLREDRPPLVSGEDARRAVEVMLAAEISIAEGRKVELPL